jgi:hypothetical protein
LMCTYGVSFFDVVTKCACCHISDMRLSLANKGYPFANVINISTHGCIASCEDFGEKIKYKSHQEIIFDGQKKEIENKNKNLFDELKKHGWKDVQISYNFDEENSKYIPYILYGNYYFSIPEDNIIHGIIHNINDVCTCKQKCDSCDLYKKITKICHKCVIADKKQYFAMKGYPYAIIEIIETLCGPKMKTVYLGNQIKLIIQKDINEDQNDNAIQQ